MNQAPYFKKYEVIIQIFLLVAALVAVAFSFNTSITAIELTKQGQLNEQQTNELATSLSQASLYLQNITSNFEPKIIPYYITATVNDVYTYMPTDMYGEIRDVGSLNISLIIITPHAAIINFTETSFEVTTRRVSDSNDWINASSFSGPHVYLTPYLPYGDSGFNYQNEGIKITNMQIFHYWPQAFVQPGVTQVNFTIGIQASIPINQNFTGALIGASLGVVQAQITLFDVQMNKTAATYNCYEQIKLNVNV